MSQYTDCASSKCSNGRYIRDWYLSLTSSAIKHVPAWYVVPPFHLFPSPLPHPHLSIYQNYTLTRLCTSKVICTCTKIQTGVEANRCDHTHSCPYSYHISCICSTDSARLLFSSFKYLLILIKVSRAGKYSPIDTLRVPLTELKLRSFCSVIQATRRQSINWGRRLERSASRPPVC